MREAPQPVAADDAHVGDAAVLELGETWSPKLGALAAGADPQAQDVTLALDGDTDGRVDGPVGDLAVALA
jgi:hypothetical protein